MFDKKSTAAAAGQRLLALKQGKWSMANFSMLSSTLAEQMKWGEKPLKSALLTNIIDELKNELMLCELPSSLVALMTLCIRVDNRVRAHWSSHAPSRYEPLGLHGASTAACGLRESEASEEE